MALKGIHLQNDDEHLRPLLTKWLRLVEEFTRAFEDAPWNYNERALLSTLAGAAWRIPGWGALEEYRTQKYRKAIPETATSDVGPGRCDLWVYSPDLQSAFEAKQTKQTISQSHANYASVAKAMKAAWEDTTRLRVDEADYRYAATFAVPKIHLSNISVDASNTDTVISHVVRATIKDWISKSNNFCLRNKGKCNPVSYAYTFPRIRDKGHIHKNHMYPGVVLILERRQRRSASQKKPQKA